MFKCIKKIITACKELSEMETREERIKDKEVFKVIFGGLLMLAVIGMVAYLLGKYVIAPLIPFAILFVIYKWNCQESSIEVQPSTYSEANILCELLCRVLSDHADILEVIPPKNVTDIIPVSYPVQQTVNGLTFYRFIVSQTLESNLSMQNIKDALFLFIAQDLTTSICPYLQSRYYRDMPYFAVFNVESDYHHREYIHIDIMPMWNDEYYYFIQNKRTAENNLAKNSHVQASPVDEDF